MKVVGLMRRMRDKSRGTTRFEDGVVEDGHHVARRQDEQFVPQRRQRQSRARREAMFGRQRDDQRLADHDFAHQRMIAHRWTHERDVELSIDERGQLRRNRHGLRLHLEVSVLSIEGAEKGRDVGLIRAVPDPDSQAPRIDAAHPSRDHGGAIGARDDVSRFLEKEPTGVRQLDASFRSVQQSHSEVVFKLPNLMTQGRLRDSQSCGGLAEMQGSATATKYRRCRSSIVGSSW
jgi:hypothetical protein